MTHFLTIVLRDVRFRILMWIVGISALTLVVPPAFEGLYSDPAERELLKETLSNPAMVAIVGPVPESTYTIAVMFAHEMIVFMAVVHGLFGIMIANAVSRKMEDNGLLEYVSSTGITRGNIFRAQLLIGFIMNITLGAVIFAGLSVMNIESFGTGGNLLYALGTTLFGILFYTFTLVLAQLLPSSDWSFGAALSILLLLYAGRAVTDVINTDYSAAFPYHWLSRMEPFGTNDYMWLLPFAVILLFIWLAWALFSKRDLDDAYIALDFKRKTRRIGTYPRLQLTGMKVLIISWLAGMLMIGLSYGAIFGDLDTFIGENELLAQAMEDASGTDPILQFISTLMMITVIVGVIPALMVSARILREEKSGRLEMLASADISRISMLITHGVLGAVTGALGLAFSVFGMYGASIGVEGIGLTLGDYMLTALNYTPAVIFFAGLSMLLIGISRKLHTLIWIYFIYAFFVNYLGLVIGLDDEWRMATPFHYLAEMPAEEIDWTAWTIITLIGAALGVTGALLFRKRDIG
ncbi:MAG TPA: ABC transporter [Candidatus Salinicoccus stercoripullorum]|uniref:ABC transporter n=1 Tax=Candidatus Salinicoccus stercoripullorum TaxID=2838756 RepID=A0A9D1QG05_9STAP|nr:ABC transporter [Candidatus Salinicoccus stercoripullorum]